MKTANPPAHPGRGRLPRLQQLANSQSAQRSGHYHL